MSRQPGAGGAGAWLKELAAEPLELPVTIGGDPIELTQPHRRQRLGGRLPFEEGGDPGQGGQRSPPPQAGL